MIEVLTIGKNLTTYEKKMELFNRYTLSRYHHNEWQNFKLNYKYVYLNVLCCGNALKFFIMENGTKVAITYCEDNCFKNAPGICKEKH